MSDGVAQDQLQAFVRRIESLEDEINALNGDKSEVYKEAKGNGFDTKVLRKVIADRRKDATERNEFDAVYQLYWDAIHGVVRAHVENIDEFGSRAKAAHAVSREEDAGERQHSSNSGKAGADEPGRQTSASADADPALNPRASRNGVEGTSEGQGATGAGTEGANPSTGATIYEPEAAMLPQTGGSETLVVSSPPVEAAATPGNDGDPTSSAGTEGEADRQPIIEPTPLSEGVAAVGGGSANHPVASAAVTIADHSKPNPICRDPGDCGVYASWAMPCQACKAAAAHRSAA